MTLLALGAMVVATVVVGSVALPVVGDQIVGGERDPGAELAAATGAAVRQANDVGSSFGRLIPARAAAVREGDGDVPHEAAVFQVLASVDGDQGDPAAKERIVAMEGLRDAWSPGYRQAAEEHRRLAYRIEHAEGAAGRYFRTQSELTGSIRNPEERSRAKALDRAEMRVYARWRDQAHRTRAQADRVMNHLHDLDVMVTKQILSANFASVRRDFLELPIAARARDLHRDLEQFRIRSQEIGAVLGGN